MLQTSRRMPVVGAVWRGSCRSVRVLTRHVLMKVDGAQLGRADERRLSHIVLEVRLQLHEEQYNYGCVAVIGAPICCSVVLHCVCFNRLIVFIP